MADVVAADGGSPAGSDLITTTPENLRAAVTSIVSPMLENMPTAEDIAAVRAIAQQRATASAFAGEHPDTIKAHFDDEHNRNVRFLGDPRRSRYGSRAELERAREEAHVIGQFITHVHHKNVPGLDSLRTQYPEFYRPAEVDKETARTNFNWTTTGEGIELVPEIWDSAILQVAEQYGYVNAIAKMYPMTTKVHHLNRGGTTTAAMVSEASAPTPIDASASSGFFKQTDMTARAAAAAFITSLELVRAATPEYIGFMTGELGRAHAQLRDEQFFNGNGTPPNHTGLIGTSGIISTSMPATKTAFSDITWTDLVSLTLSLPSSAANNAVLIVPRSVFAYLVAEKDGVTGRPIWNFTQPVDIGKYQGVKSLGAPLWTPLGIPMLVVPNGLFPTTAAGKVAAIYGDLSQYGYFGNLTGFAINTFKEYYGSTALGGTRQIAIETTELFGLAFPAPAGIGVLKTAAS